MLNILASNNPNTLPLALVQFCFFTQSLAAAALEMASVPAYLLPGNTIAQPLYLEGDSTLATEILPGPPALISTQQSTHRRDLRKLTTITMSYLPTSDPGSTYSGLTSSVTGGQGGDGPRRKRVRVEKGYVSLFKREIVLIGVLHHRHY